MQNLTSELVINIKKCYHLLYKNKDIILSMQLEFGCKFVNLLRNIIFCVSLKHCVVNKIQNGACVCVCKRVSVMLAAV